MSTFEASKNLFSQQHFTVVELVLPEITGACTIGTGDGYGTPITCDQVWNGTDFVTYRFTTENAPLLPDSPIYRQVVGINESPTELQPGEGLAVRGSGSINFRDFKNVDPNPDSPAVAANLDIIDQGTFFGKLIARQVMQNNVIRIKNYRVEEDGTVDLDAGAETRTYIIETFASNGKGQWKCGFKEELTKVNFDETVFPDKVTRTGTLNADITDAVVSFAVNLPTAPIVTDIILIGDEFMKITIVVDDSNDDYTITVGTRGNAILGAESQLLTRTDTDAHNEDDEVFICRVSDDERIDDLLTDILLSVGVSLGNIPVVEWAAEVDEWHSGTLINTIWYKSEATNDSIKSILTAYLMDMWFDPVTRLINLSAISVWKESSSTIAEGSQIDFETVRFKDQERLRATKAFVLFDKEFLARSDDVENYRKASVFDDLNLAGLFQDTKTKQFEPNKLLDLGTAGLLVQRYVARFGSRPQAYNFTTQERFLDFVTGDVVNIETDDKQAFDGSKSNTNRAQILSVKPTYKNGSREYKIKALSYEPQFQSDDVIRIQADYDQLNLFDYIGRPSQAVELWIFIGRDSDTSAVFGRSSGSNPMMRAGGFAVGSVLHIVQRYGSDAQGRGGAGGRGNSAFFDSESSSWIFGNAGNGAAGGVVYDNDGIETTWYLDGNVTTPEGVIASDGQLRAPGGGDGGFESSTDGLAGNGGNGADGRNAGVGGVAGDLNFGIDLVATPGLPGNDLGTTSGWGLAGTANDAVAGLAGSGIKRNGTILRVVGGATLVGGIARFVNGAGDTPSAADAVPPVISAIVNDTISDTNVLVTWTTDEAASSQIEFGLTAGYGSTTTEDPTLVTSHSHTFTGLVASTLYHYRVISKDAAGNETMSADQTVTTAATPSETVAYGDHTITHFRLSPADAIAGFIFKRDGKIYQVKGASTTFLANWITPDNPSIGDDYELEVTKNSGDTLQFGTLATWQIISIDRLYQITETGINTTTINLTVKVRDLATSTEQDSQTFILNAIVEN